jgi:hypothetical protein
MSTEPSVDTSKVAAEAPTVDTEEAPKKRKPKADKGEPKAKRGPARPHRRLATEIIDERIAKLQKRLDRARSQIDDAGRHIEGYQRERRFRQEEAGPDV